MPKLHSISVQKHIELQRQDIYVGESATYPFGKIMVFTGKWYYCFMRRTVIHIVPDILHFPFLVGQVATL